MLTEPNPARACPGDPRRRALLHQVSRDQHGLARTCCRHLGGNLIEQLGAARNEGQPYALARQRQRDAATDTDAGAGHGAVLPRILRSMGT